MHELTTFSFDGALVRSHLDADGQPWFVAADVCAVLDLGNPRTSLALLDEDERGVHTVDTPGGTQQSSTVSESGMYSLVLRSRKPEAKRFKKWVTGEVLPSIRKTGAYGRPAVDPMAVLNDPAAMRGLLLVYTERVISLEAQVASAAPKVEALERFALADGDLCISYGAKSLQLRPKDLFTWLHSNGWTFRRLGSPWIGHQEYLGRGLLTHKVTTVERSDGSSTAVTQVRVTPKGLAHLAEVVPRYGVNPRPSTKEKAAAKSGQH